MNFIDEDLFISLLFRVAFGVKKRKGEEWKNRFKSLEGCSYLANVSRPEIDTAKAKKEDF